VLRDKGLPSVLETLRGLRITEANSIHISPARITFRVFVAVYLYIFE